MASTATKSLAIRLVCRTMPVVPAIDEALDIGIQDKAQNVHGGRSNADGSVHFDCAVEARLDGPQLDFRGPFVHGTPQSRFIYLSWKRRVVTDAPWHWRVKVPLAGIPPKAVASLKPGQVLVADITGRRPHATDPISWSVADGGAA